MVRNKRELINAFVQWMNAASQDVTRHLNDFMQRANVDSATLANMLDESQATIDAALQGNVATLPLSLFAKILIATGHVIAIMPEDQMHRGGMAVPMRGSMPTPPRENNRPMRDARGRFVSPTRGCEMPHCDMTGGNMPFPHEVVGGPMEGYPMPNPNGQLPSPQEIAEMARAQAEQDAARNRRNTMAFNDDIPLYPNEIPDEEEVMPDRAIPTTTEDPINQLANALRNNPEIANLLGSILGTNR